MPDFIAVGPQRTGTTWFHEALQGQVGLPRGIKETDFFGENYSRGIEWYLAHFRGYPASMPIGEVDPNYFANDAARERIAEHIPQCKIICSLREPVARAVSHYRMLRHYTWARSGSFEQVLESHPEILDHGRYAHHLGLWRARFGTDKVLVCLYDDLQKDRQAFLNSICDFIRIPPVVVRASMMSLRAVNSFQRQPKNLRLARRARRLKWTLKNHGYYRLTNLFENAGVWRFCFGRGEEFPPLEAGTEARLRAHFLPDIEALEQILGRDLSAWKTAGRGASPPAARMSSSVTA